MEKIEALSIYLGCEEDEISEGYDECTFEYGREKYLVCTDEEADDRCKEYILDTLWAFNTSFIKNYIDTKTDYNEKSLCKCLVALQDLCEASNYLTKLLVGNRIDEFIDDAISTDRRSHYLASYDGEENEESGYFIYRTN
jgi:hypothetical protein